MKSPTNKNRLLLRSLAGWCGLWLYVGALSPAGFTLTACLAELDPDHHIQFQPGEQGLRLVLHHEGDCAGHRHGAVARVLTAFAQPASNTDPDHVLKFSATTGVTRGSQLLLPVANSSEPTAIVFAAPVSPDVLSPIHFIPPPRPPPDTFENLLCLSSTVILI